MTIEEIINSDRLWLRANDIAPILESDPHDLRVQAREHPETLGFPSSCPTKTKVIFPRIPFLRFFGYEEKPATNGELQTTNTLE